MQIYYLTKYDIKLEDATNAVIIDYILYQISLLLIGIFALIYNSLFHVYDITLEIKYALILGYAVNIIGILALSGSIFAKNTMQKIITNIIVFLSKIKLIKNKKERLEKTNKQIDDFYLSSRTMINRKGFIKKALFINILSLSFRHLTAAFIIYASGIYKLNPLQAFTASALTFVCAAFIPIPGGSGGTEYFFVKFISKYMLEPFAKVILLSWRLITYYLPMIIGLILTKIGGKKWE